MERGGSESARAPTKDGALRHREPVLARHEALRDDLVSGISSQDQGYGVRSVEVIVGQREIGEPCPHAVPERPHRSADLKTFYDLQEDLETDVRIYFGRHCRLADSVLADM
ncbi:hypothetical protein ACLKA6_002150 [Drosophila palustris]